MPLYCGIDLHSTNSVTVVTDAEDKVLVDKRLPNRLPVILKVLEPFREDLEGIAVESTFNWYWLVDGLMEAGHRVHLVNTSAIEQYEGLKFTDDHDDARWLAHLLRLGILPTGYIYPKETRAIRDLLRLRIRLVQQKTSNYLGVHSLLAQNTGRFIRGNALKRLDPVEAEASLASEERRIALKVRLQLIDVLEEHIREIEQEAQQRAKQKPEFGVLQTMRGVGPILAMIILYETGDIRRFSNVGCYASYCRCVRTERRSNRKKKGVGNRKNGNPYLSWAFGQAAFFARRFQPRAQRFYHRKLAQRNALVAHRALAHKLCRAAYFMLRDRVPYQESLLFP